MSNGETRYTPLVDDQLSLDLFVEKKANEIVNKRLKTIGKIFTPFFSLLFTVLGLLGLDVRNEYQSIRNSFSDIKTQWDELKTTKFELQKEIGEAKELVAEIKKEKEKYDREIATMQSTFHTSLVGLNDVYDKQTEIKEDYNKLLSDTQRNFEVRNALFREEVDKTLAQLQNILKEQDDLLEKRLATVGKLEKRVNDQLLVIVGEMDNLKKELNVLEARMKKIKQDNNGLKVSR